MKTRDKLVLENVTLLFRNFSGKAGNYNEEGDRSVCIKLDPSLADELSKDGWNVRVLQPRDDDAEPGFYLPVTVSYRNVEPNIYTHIGKQRTRITEDTVSSLDYVDIINADIAISPYHWERRTKNGTDRGIKAFLKTMHLTIDQDEFADKYRDEEEEVPFL